ncbi:MAG: DUF4249 family protein [Cyclobacteriaceae bacterium]
MILVGSCIDRIDDSLNNENSTIVIDGYISDLPGPYKIRIFRSVGSEKDLARPPMVELKQVSIFDDVGNKEILEKRTLSDGAHVEYWTKPDGIKGEVGRKYVLRVELASGKILESTPEKIHPVGTITDISYVFESYKPLQGQTEYGFRVFMNAEDVRGKVRWRFTGTHIVETYPELRLDPIGGCRGLLNPAPCSGYITDGFSLVKVGECTCCRCWNNEYEDVPNLSDEVIATNGRFGNVEMAYVPFDVWRFHFRKYLVKVEQMSLSDDAFEYWKVIKDQKVGVNSLFQPAFGKIATNFLSSDPDIKVAGFFYATAISQKTIMISAEDASIKVPTFDRPGNEVCLFWNACDASWPNASRTPPPEWED